MSIGLIVDNRRSFFDSSRKSCSFLRELIPVAYAERDNRADTIVTGPAAERRCTPWWSSGGQYRQTNQKSTRNRHTTDHSPREGHTRHDQQGWMTLYALSIPSHFKEHRFRPQKSSTSLHKRTFSSRGKAENCRWTKWCRRSDKSAML